eukprot:187625_1
MANEAAIVIDNGSWHIKAGMNSFNDFPHVTFASIIGERTGSTIGGGKVCIGDDIRPKGMFSIRSPFEQSNITNWDDMETIWHYMFSNQLNIDPREHNCFITEKCYNSVDNSYQMTEIMFETFRVPSFYIHNEAPLALYGAGNLTGVVVNCGHGTTCCTPIYKGDVLTDAIRRLDIGGQHITNYLAYLLSSWNLLNIPPHLVEQIKTTTGEVAATAHEEKSTYTYSDTDLNFELPDGQVITIGEERLCCFEPLFQKNSSNIIEFVNESIMSCNSQDIRNRLYGAMILVGGTTKCSGFDERFRKEMRTLNPDMIIHPNNADTNRDYAVWIGGSVLTSISSFKDKWISNKLYDEIGMSVIHRMNDISTRYKYTSWHYIQGTKAHDYISMNIPINYKLNLSSYSKRKMQNKVLTLEEQLKKQKMMTEEKLNKIRIQKERETQIKCKLVNRINKLKNIDKVSEELLIRFTVNDIYNTIKKK